MRDETIDESARLANAIIVLKDDRPDPFFDEAARAMLRAVILHVVTSPDFLPEERTLLTAQALLKRGDWQTYEAMEADGQTEIDSPHVLLWRSLQINPAFGGVVASDGSRFLSMIDKSPKTFESVLQTVLNNLEFLDSPGMRRVLARSNFSLAELKTNPRGMTLYLSLPQRFMDTHHRWLRMMVTLITSQMEISRGRPATGHPVLLILDEFAGWQRAGSEDSDGSVVSAGDERGRGEFRPGTAGVVNRPDDCGAGSVACNVGGVLHRIWATHHGGFVRNASGIVQATASQTVPNFWLRD